MFNGKMKALTFSYDDGVTQDIRLIELLNKYGMKATFNINSEMLGKSGSLVREGVEISHTKINPEDVRRVYEGHEVAAHTLTHPLLIKIDDDKEIIRQVEEDRLNLSKLVGYEVVGFAYPGGQPNYDSRVAELIKNNTGIKYCRTTVTNHSFDTQDNLFEFLPTAHHIAEFDNLFKMGEEFINLKTDKPKVFYIWGHSYEFDIANTWDKFEEFLKMMAFKDDICYCTNKEALLK